MRRNYKTIFIITTFTAVTVFFIIFTIIKLINIENKAPFLLSDNYYSFTVSQYDDFENANQTEPESLKDSIYNLICSYDNLIVLKESCQYDKLSLYDPSLYYSIENLNGIYFTKDDFIKSNINKIIVDETSVYSRLIENKKLYISGSYKNVIATYSHDYPLKRFSRGYYFIQTLANDDNLNGNYYFDNCDDSLIKNIVSLFENNNYEVSLTHNINNSNNTSFKNIFSKKEFFIMIPSLLIILFADFITFCLLFLRSKNMINVHYCFGARNKNLFLFILREIIVTLILGSVLGCLIGFIFIFTIYKETSFTSITITLLFNIILFISVTFTAFIYMKRKIVKEDL